MKITIEIPDAEIHALLARGLPPPVSSPDDIFVTRAGAVRLGLEGKAAMRAEREGRLSAYKPGRQVLYKKAAVLALIESSRLAPVPANDAEPEDPFERAVARAESGR